MSAPGKKAIPKQVKAARGTLQPCRDGVDTREKRDGPVSPALSIVPPPLPDTVAEVWADYVEVAVNNGAKQCDADSFAEWCTMAATLRSARAKEIAAPASYVAQFRMLGELFGLAGPGSRLLKKGPEQDKSNPFSRNGVRK